MAKSELRIFRVLRYWIPLAVGITFLAGLVYLAVQQNYRMNANDPQIQMAEDAGLALGEGKNPKEIIGNVNVDMRTSLAPYYIIYNQNGKVLASSAFLNDKTPNIPETVFADVKENGEERFTWQPVSGVRSAVVIVYYQGMNNSGFVLAGRSLREVEVREDALELQVGAVWVISLVSAFIAVFILL